ncbi:unnamed protein product [Peronospora belbahrii]|uniref:Uncharacterized protein n=1 Tax=Peronospora belbahrii TaxID=622444 RepID=A0ABN8CZ03_9STRA|nr:unnamed protein product [Peronospora belbahrii]
MDALQNVLRPGSREFVVVLNIVLLLLFFVMLTVIYTEMEDSFHVFVLLFLVMGLTVSINWFIIKANNLQHSLVANSNNKQQSFLNVRAKTD